ncbi:hypothetical protein CEQ90_05075 [Lewinellaceae bacterium SD302]|nr:hypothetical protein CEQ90_05075 [Lewinellaceae bacterium SD302]
MLFSCNPADKEQETPMAEPDVPNSLPEDFRNFYQQFHADSLYQIEHIQWPLSGMPDRAIQEGESFAFTKDNWKMQRPVLASSGYRSQFTMLTEDLVVEEIINPSDGTGLLRRFLKDGEQWTLIYYQGVRKLQ